MGFVFDIITELSTAGQLIASVLQLELLNYLISGGWVTILRSIGFFIDRHLVGFITKGFDYFQLIIGRTLIVPATVESITRNVYFFIAAILFFKLAVRIMKYIIDPNLTGDDNIGVNSLVKRVIIGMILILFMPTIFSILRDFQSAIISDKVIEKTIMDRTTYNKYNEITKRAPVGRIIGFSVLQGFLNFNDNLGGAILSFGSGNQEKQWETAKETFDPSAIKDINAGGFLASDTYLFDYIPILSTIALGYTLYLIIKYCFDVLVRSFYLTILQVISPIVIVDYIMDGDREGSFKNWLKTTTGVFLMLFIRIVSLWFIIFVAVQMQMTNKECFDNLVDQGITSEEAAKQCDSSILHLNNNGEVDMLLRAGIIIALLAVSMDMPKLIGKIFNIDLEQESSVTGMINKIGGIGKMVGMAGAAFGGAMLGGAVKNIGAGAKGMKARHDARSSAISERMKKTGESRKEAMTALGIGHAGRKNFKEQWKATKKDEGISRSAAKSKVRAENAGFREGKEAMRNANNAGISTYSANTQGIGSGIFKAAVNTTGVGRTIQQGFNKDSLEFLVLPKNNKLKQNSNNNKMRIKHLDNSKLIGNNSKLIWLMQLMNSKYS